MQAKCRSAPVFIACRVTTIALAELGIAPNRPSAARSSICPPAMPPRPERARKLAHQRDRARPASGWVSSRDENVEGESEQRVAGEDRGRIVIGLVRGRPAAPQIVVVHRRQIVMHQRIAMDAFERGAGHQRVLARHAEQGRALHHQKRPQPLAAAERGIAHRVEQARRALDFALHGLSTTASG